MTEPARRHLCPSRSVAALLLGALAAAQEPRSPQAPPGGFLRPPDAIARLVETPAPPDASLSPQRQWLVLTTREPLRALETLSRPHLKLAGLRVDPDSRGPQLGTRVAGISLRAMASGEERALPIPPGHWSGPYWSADDRAFALVRAADGGGELWIADPADSAPVRVDGVAINAVLRVGVQWLPDQQRLLVPLVVPGAPPARPPVPSGPTVQVTTPGAKAQVRTYQDLLQDEHDEALLAHFATSQLAIVDAATRAVRRIGTAAMYQRAEPSPDGTLLLVERVERPFSYALPLMLFPRVVEVCDLEGKAVRVVARSGLRDAVPIGGVPTGPRSVDWLPALPHALAWVEALDGGDPRADVPHRDVVQRLAEPGGDVVPWFRTEHRAGGLVCGADAALVLAGEVDRKTRRERIWRYDARDPARPGVMLYERSTQDAYGDPGRPISDRLPDGRSMLRMRDGALFLAGQGASPAGNRPFVDRWDPTTGAKERLFHAAPGRHETFVGFVGDGEDRLLVRSESPTEPPALVVVDRASGERSLLLALGDPVAELTKGVQKRLVEYTREDGVALSGTLYLPPGRRDGEKLPCLVWAYPLEYTQASDAAQVRAAPNRYVRIGGSSHLALLLAGYAVLDDAAMPIVGPRRTANDTFVAQIQQNARAAVAALEREGIDPRRIAVAGHSYGAFMTANLLAHTDLFACGIARSGAYNRTLTPFGFQNEDRTYWEAPEVYHAMSPFAHAHRIGEPLLLIHGDDDDNSGTFPMQSERLFAAIKGHGGTARLCMLPHESHGYAARENVLHCLAEMCAWLDQHCKGSGG